MRRAISRAYDVDRSRNRAPVHGRDPGSVICQRITRNAYGGSAIQAILAAAGSDERTLIGPPCVTVARPGKVAALDGSAIGLEAGTARIIGSRDHWGRTQIEWLPGSDSNRRPTD